MLRVGEWSCLGHSCTNPTSLSSPGTLLLPLTTQIHVCPVGPAMPFWWFCSLLEDSFPGTGCFYLVLCCCDGSWWSQSEELGCILSIPSKAVLPTHLGWVNSLWVTCTSCETGLQICVGLANLSGMWLVLVPDLLPFL